MKIHAKYFSIHILSTIKIIYLIHRIDYINTIYNIRFAFEILRLTTVFLILLIDIQLSNLLINWIL